MEYDSWIRENVFPRELWEREGLGFSVEEA